MISDTLFDAANEIREYQREYPDYYDAIKQKLELLLQHMDLVRRELDTPPTGDEPKAEWISTKR